MPICPTRLNPRCFAGVEMVRLLIKGGYLLVFAVIPLCLTGCANTSEPLLVLCAPAIRLPVEATARAYEAEYHIPVQLQFGGSQTLLASLQIANNGDLFIPADDDYLVKAREKGLVADTIPLSELTPVLALRKNDPRSFTTLRELPNNLTLSLADPDAAAIGRVTRETLGAVDYQALHARAKVIKPMVTEVGMDVRLGAVDAGIVWDSTVRQMPELKALEVAEFHGKKAFVSVAILCGARDQAAARRFARYLASSDRGMVQFKNFGFTPAAGEKWRGS